MTRAAIRCLFILVLSAPGLAGCGISPSRILPAALAPQPPEEEIASRSRERECLVRAMYFEAHQASRDGLLAVGSVVMNRVKSEAFPNTICEVVGQPRQFAAGVLTRPMAARSLPLVESVADEVLAGKRHESIGKAAHFHRAGLRFHYPNMHYVLVAGGNAFYEKRARAAPGSGPQHDQPPAALALVPVKSDAPLIAAGRQLPPLPPVRPLPALKAGAGEAPQPPSLSPAVPM